MYLNDVFQNSRLDNERMHTIRGRRLSSRINSTGGSERINQISRSKKSMFFLVCITKNSLMLILQVFHFTSKCIELNPAFRDYEERSSKIDDILKKLRADNVFIALKGWRDEVVYIINSKYC